MQRIIFNFILAMEGVFSNKLRAFLTALGIIFGVGAVIAMLAIGNGAKQAILEQMKLIGTNNIVIESKILSDEEVEEATEENKAGTQQKSLRPWSPGLTMEDAMTIDRLIPTIERVSPEIVLSTNIIQSGKLEKAKCIGVSNTFFELNNLSLSKGTFFHEKHVESGKPVCIIGKSVQAKFFPEDSPIGQKIKCGNAWLTIIGVLEKRTASLESLESLGIRDYNSDVYIPISTALIRFQNRAAVSKEDIKRGDWDDEVNKSENYHQLDKLVLRVDRSESMQATAQVIARILKRRHQGLIDYEVKVPELELQQEQATKDRLNLVLAFIAGISLLVGGIGIMNIMLATVLERIKEIGVRRSLGAMQKDIILQFLFEAIFISLIGGLIGVILGVSTAYIIENYFEIPAKVSSWSVIVSFFVSASVGLIFGLFPAEQASKMDPIKALRTD